MPSPRLIEGYERSSRRRRFLVCLTAWVLIRRGERQRGGGEGERGVNGCDVFSSSLFFFFLAYPTIQY